MTRLRLLLFFCLCVSKVSAQEERPKSMELFGHIMTDIGYNFGSINPNWFDVVRTTQMPAFKNQYGTNGNVYFSVRQTRFGIKNYIPTPLGELKTNFEFELFGVGVDAGQTTFRLRNAYAELGKFGVGQYNSPFMDIDVFPNTLEYWGPSGMVFFRNVQIRYMPIQGKSHLTFALERPGASADEGKFVDRIELDDVRGRFPVPDFSTEYRKATKWGYVELAGMLRYIGWEDQNNDQFDLSGSEIGWGLNLSTNVAFSKSTIFRGQVVYGEGVQNYMDDAPTDIGIENNFTNPTKPVKGVALPILGIVAFVDHTWNEKFTSSIGYSTNRVTNSNGQEDNAFRQGHYAAANLLWHPSSNMMMGAELQYGRRENYADGFASNLVKLQCSFKYKFGHIFYRSVKN